MWKHFENSKVGQVTRPLNISFFFYKRQNLTEKSLTEASAWGEQPQSRAPNCTRTNDTNHLSSSGFHHSPTTETPLKGRLQQETPLKHGVFMPLISGLDRASSCPKLLCERGETWKLTEATSMQAQVTKVSDKGAGEARWVAGLSLLHLPSCLAPWAFLTQNN